MTRPILRWLCLFLENGGKDDAPAKTVASDSTGVRRLGCISQLLAPARPRLSTPHTRKQFTHAWKGSYLDGFLLSVIPCEREHQQIISMDVHSNLSRQFLSNQHHSSSPPATRQHDPQFLLSLFHSKQTTYNNLPPDHQPGKKNTSSTDNQDG